MRPLVLIREGFATAWANKVPTALVALLVATMVAATLATVGRTAAAERQLAQRLDAAGSRVLTVRDAHDKGLISPSTVAAAGALSVTERAAGATSPVDVVSGAVGVGGTRVPAWGIVGELSDVVSLVAGRWPGPGEALVSAEAMEQLGFSEPFGWVQEPTSAGAQLNVVGQFKPREPFGEYGAGVVYHAGSTSPNQLLVILHRASDAAVAQQAVLGLIATDDLTSLAVSSPIAIADLRSQVLADLGGFGRTLLLGVLGAGAVLISIVVLADVLVRRSDLGRRRVLGATRGVIVGIVTLRTLAPALLGAGLGIGAGWWITSWLGAVPPVAFSAAVAVLAVLAATGSAVPPALFAATRDPVAVLRTP